jgi:uncharacterized protein (TIGR00369 family)
MTVDLIRDETIFPSALMQCIGFEEVLSLGAEGVSEVRFRARPEFAHSKGTTVQGGIVTAWLDCAMAWAVHARDPARSIATLDVSVKYLTRVSVDAHVCRARVVKWGRSVAFLEAELYDLEGKCLTRASSTGLLLATGGA